MSGFGIPNHLRGLSCALAAARAARPALAGALGCPTADIVVAGTPKLLFKPASRGGGALAAHVDGGVPLRELHARTAACGTNGAWATTHGVQSLAHLRCIDGHTSALRGLTVCRYHVLLTMLHPEARRRLAASASCEQSLPVIHHRLSCMLRAHGVLCERSLLF